MSGATTETSDSERAESDPPASYGLATATWVVVAGMVGTGVLTMSGYTVLSVRSNQLMLFLWVVGGIVALCGAFAAAELGASLPRSGGDYVFLREAYGPFAAFLSGWVSFLIGFGGPIAIAASASARYVLAPFAIRPSMLPYAINALATVSIIAFAVIHVLGRTLSVRAQALSTIVKLGLLILYVVFGLIAGRRGVSHLADRPPIDSQLLMAMLFSLVYVSYAYTGWNTAAYIAGEIKNPKRNLPLALIGGTAGVALLYLAINLVYATAFSASDIVAFGPEKVAEIAGLAATSLYGKKIGDPLSVAIGLMLYSSLSAYVLTGPRVLYAMAREGQFPSVAARLTKRARTPAIATAIQSTWSIFLLWVAPFETILEYASVGLAIFSMLTISSVYVLRYRRPDLPRPFRAPGYPVTPAIYLIVTAMLTAAAFAMKPIPSLCALACVLIGVPVYWLWPGLGSRSPRNPSK